jgi:hypothetical protein
VVLGQILQLLVLQLQLLEEEGEDYLLLVYQEVLAEDREEEILAVELLHLVKVILVEGLDQIRVIQLILAEVVAGQVLLVLRVHLTEVPVLAHQILFLAVLLHMLEAEEEEVTALVQAVRAEVEMVLERLWELEFLVRQILVGEVVVVETVLVTAVQAVQAS